MDIQTAKQSKIYISTNFSKVNKRTVSEFRIHYQVHFLVCFNQAQTEIKVVELNPNLETVPAMVVISFSSILSHSFGQRAIIRVNRLTSGSSAMDLWPLTRSSVGAADEQGTLQPKKATAASGRLAQGFPSGSSVRL